MRAFDEILSGLAPKKKALIIGAAFIDVIVHVPTLPKSGGDAMGSFHGSTVGGCAFNVADALHKLQAPMDLFIPVGSGPYAELVRSEMNKKQYKISVESEIADNGWCISLVEESGERTFISVPGIETQMQSAWFDTFDLSAYDYFYVSGYEAEGANGFVLLDALRKKKPEALILFDPGPRALFIEPKVLQGFIELGMMFSINRSEALALTKETDLETAGKKLFNWSSNPAIITDGGNGAVIAANTLMRVPGFEVDVVDTIGAGDSHTGGLLAGLICGLPLEESVYLANKIASVVVSRSGASSAPTLQELKRI